MNSFELRLVAIRLHFGLSIRGMSRHLGLAPAAWHHYEHGIREPSMQSLVKLAQLGVNVNWLLTGEGQMLLNPAQTAPVTAQPSKAEAISELVTRLNQLLETPDGTNLYAWQEIVRHIQELPNGATVEQLAAKMYSSYPRENLERDLQVLVAEGILGEAKGTYRLIRAYASQEHTAYELRVLNMVRILLQEHLPSIKISPRGKWMTQWDIFVERGQGVERLREVQRGFKALVSSSDTTRKHEQQERISFLLSMVVNEHEDNPNVGK